MVNDIKKNKSSREGKRYLMSARIQEVKGVITTLAVLVLLVVGTFYFSNNYPAIYAKFLQYPVTPSLGGPNLFTDIARTVKESEQLDQQIKDTIQTKLQVQQDINLYTSMISEEIARQKELEVERSTTSAVIRYFRYLESVGNLLNVKVYTEVNEEVEGEISPEEAKADEYFQNAEQQDKAITTSEEGTVSNGVVPIISNGNMPSGNVPADNTPSNPPTSNIPGGNVPTTEPPKKVQVVKVKAEGSFPALVEFAKRLETSEIYYIYDYELATDVEGKLSLSYKARFEGGER